MKFQPTKKHQFKAVPKYMIYEDCADKKSHFLILRNYYTDDLELKRVKENMDNRNMINLLFMSQTKEECI